MSKYIIKRILIAIPVLIGITIIDYAIMCLAGSPLEMLQGPRVSEAAVEAKAIALGLDKPFYIQYFVWLGQLLQGNMGYSIKSFQSVSGMIGSQLGSGRDLQCGASVFRRGLWVGDVFFFGQQYPRFFSVFAVGFRFYGKAWMASFQRYEHAGNGRQFWGCGAAHGDAGNGACHIHCRQEYPLH